MVCQKCSSIKRNLKLTSKTCNSAALRDAKPEAEPDRKCLGIGAVLTTVPADYRPLRLGSRKPGLIPPPEETNSSWSLLLATRHAWGGGGGGVDDGGSTRERERD
ncbi:hypothetical protein NHX12_029998 [Muraenolepis orangiensis]|uniref:Uncharacterized protein n=1 Tax=Muraenolepis orangiensis TaxID=630683 RepID=A0A9Q0E7A8_9TELE|nr:hypothetical protein NHX12_029998 [Muraenolepis orangiensis]